MGTNNPKFSDLIIELSEIWRIWIPKNKLSHDINISCELRRKYAEECEEIITHRYEIMKQLDKYFQNNDK
jgi:hypothetical protein